MPQRRVSTALSKKNDGGTCDVFMVHVGGTRCVTSSTDNTMTRQACITWGVECIRACIFIFLFDVEIQWQVRSLLTLFSI